MRGFSPHGASCAPRGGRTRNQLRHARSCAQRGTVDVVELGHGRLGRHDHDLHVVHGGQEHHVDQVDHGARCQGGNQRKQGAWRAHTASAGRDPGAIAVASRHVPVGTLFSSSRSLNSVMLGHCCSRPFFAAAHGHTFATVPTGACTAPDVLSSADRPPCGTHSLALRAHTQQTLYFTFLLTFAVSYMAAAATPPSLVYVLCFHKAHDISRCRRRRKKIFLLSAFSSRSGGAGRRASPPTQWTDDVDRGTRKNGLKLVITPISRP